MDSFQPVNAKYKDRTNGRREDLIGGGLIHSQGGWANEKAMRRAKIFEKADF
jgi:hypothetical protein